MNAIPPKVSTTGAPARDFAYSPLFPLGPDATPYRRLDIGGVSTLTCDGRTVLRIAPATLSALARAALRDVSHLLRSGHLAQLRRILDDPEASANDRFVAVDLLKNANIAAGGRLPMCQDTGTAIVFGKKGQRVWVEGDEETALSAGIAATFRDTNLRYSQMAPLTMYDEVNTGNNLPVQFDIAAAPGEERACEFHLMFIAKGGGSANKTFLYQETRALLASEDKLLEWLGGKIRTLGTSACPPYHLAVVIGGLSAELTLKTVKLASTRYLDALPDAGSRTGHAFRDRALEARVHALTQNLGIGAQFGGKYFCHDVRVVRLPRHGASLPVGIGVSCSADRQTWIGRWTRSAPSWDATPSRPGWRSPARSSSRATSRTRRSRNDSIAARACRDIFATTRSTMRAPPRRRRACRPARSARPRPAAWTATSRSSSAPADPS